MERENGLLLQIILWPQVNVEEKAAGEERDRGVSKTRLADCRRSEGPGSFSK